MLVMIECTLTDRMETVVKVVRIMDSMAEMACPEYMGIDR